MYYVSPLDGCIHWLTVKHSLALIMLQIMSVFQTNTDQCRASTCARRKKCTCLRMTGKVSLLELAGQTLPLVDSTNYKINMNSRSGLVDTTSLSNCKVLLGDRS